MIPLLAWVQLALGAPLTADDAVQRALDLSPDVASAAADVDAALARKRAASTFRSDPSLQVRWAAVGEARSAMLTQPVSLTGGGLAARSAARWEAAAAESATSRSRLEVAAWTRTAWVVAVWRSEDVRLTREALDLTVRLREGAEARLLAGEASALEVRVARAQEEVARADWVDALRAEATALVGVSTATGVAPADLELPRHPELGMPATEAAVQDSGRSDVKAAAERRRAAEAALRRERADTLPPVRIGVFAEEEGAEQRMGPTLSVQLPVWSRNAAARGEARARRNRLEAAHRERARAADAEQQATVDVLGVLAAQPPSAPLEDQEALASLEVGVARGELDLLTAGVLRAAIVAGQRAAARRRASVVIARIDRALAYEDPGLLGPRP